MHQSNIERFFDGNGHTVFQKKRGVSVGAFIFVKFEEGSASIKSEFVSSFPQESLKYKGLSHNLEAFNLPFPLFLPS